jgi:hypothetical protein
MGGLNNGGGHGSGALHITRMTLPPHNSSRDRSHEPAQRRMQRSDNSALLHACGRRVVFPDAIDGAARGRLAAAHCWGLWRTDCQRLAPILLMAMLGFCGERATVQRTNYRQPFVVRPDRFTLQLLPWETIQEEKSNEENRHLEEELKKSSVLILFSWSGVANC